MNNTACVNNTSKFLLKKEMNESVINEYTVVGYYNSITISFLAK